MGRIVDDFETVNISDFLNALHVAGRAIDMDRHDGRSVRSDGRFDFFGIDISCRFFDIDKYWLETVPPNRMCGCYKAIGCSDDFSSDFQCLQRRNERECSVGEKADVFDTQVFCESLF